MSQNDPAILYQFPISHYCEKARWALDFKGLRYQIVNLAPGLHMRKTRKMGCAGSTLPILQFRSSTVQGSDAIVDFLDRELSERRLTPADQEQAEEAMNWEKLLDREVGIHLRRFIYFHVLPNSALAKRLILHQATLATKTVFTLSFPLIRSFMRRGMNIRPETAEKSRHRLEQAFAQLNARLKSHPYLAGERFSRADLSAAALLAPLCMPPEHPFPFPKEEEMPEPLRSFQRAHRQDPFFAWTLKMYREHRG